MDTTVSVLDRGTMRIDLNYPIEGAVTATDSEPNPDAVRADGPVFNLVIDTPEHTLLWDTGSHPEAAEGHWSAETYDTFTHADAAAHPLPDALADAGYALADIDAVVQSHLHLDHAGGLHNFAGTDVPVFVHERELKEAYFAAATGREGAYIRGDFDHDLAWEPLYGDGGLLVSGVEWLHLPGHTPGMVGLLVEDGAADGRDLLVVGDLAYSSVNYEEGHPMGRDLLDSRHDWRESLRRARDVEKRRDALVVYGHDPEQVAALPALL
ncbi:N-acyl homoserine lactonase family protein [Halosegnis marinus]|uniref:N-acyl homoserine lactonase family protein n=1 Tax=Halosegnis marinus TaxID=3034023 RepID=A0ABD5ZQ53_9EURY|nr:N-acyl homoserine lactonase family protein [Halosegnis sp. DT85]